MRGDELSSFLVMLLVQKCLPVLAAVDDADDDKVVIGDPVDDQVRAVGVEPNRRIDIGALTSNLRMVA